MTKDPRIERYLLFHTLDPDSLDDRWVLRSKDAARIFLDNHGMHGIEYWELTGDASKLTAEAKTAVEAFEAGVPVEDIFPWDYN